MLPNFWSLNMSNFEFLSWKLENPYRNQSYYCRWNFWLCSRNFPPNVETHPKRSSLLLLMCDTSAFYTLWPAVRLHLWKNIKKNSWKRLNLGLYFLIWREKIAESIKVSMGVRYKRILQLFGQPFDFISENDSSFISTHRSNK